MRQNAAGCGRMWQKLPEKAPMLALQCVLAEKSVDVLPWMSSRALLSETCDAYNHGDIRVEQLRVNPAQCDDSESRHLEQPNGEPSDARATDQGENVPKACSTGEDCLPWPTPQQDSHVKEA